MPGLVLSSVVLLSGQIRLPLFREWSLAVWTTWLRVGKRVMKKTLAALIFIISLVVSACGGGGGGGGGFVGAADLQLEVEPRVVDPGDRLFVRIRINEIHEDGIMLKLRFPSAIRYVRDSAMLYRDRGDDQGRAYPPTENETVESSIYLVFFVDHDDLEGDNRGELLLELEAREEVDDGQVEVDADVDNPRVDDDKEFDAENPAFAAEDRVYVDVIE